MRKKGKSRGWRWAGVIAAATLLILFLSYHQGDSLCRIRLLSVESNAENRPVVVCRITNLSTSIIYYPCEFHVERWNETVSSWEYYDESTWNVAFPLSVRRVRPFERKTEEYSVFVYADPFEPGRYRIVQQMSADDCGSTALYIPHFCEFTIEDP